MTRMPNNYNSKECEAFAYRQWDMRCSQRDSENTYSWRKQRSRNSNSSPCCTDRRRGRLPHCSRLLRNRSTLQNLLQCCTCPPGKSDIPLQDFPLEWLCLAYNICIEAPTRVSFRWGQRDVKEEDKCVRVLCFEAGSAKAPLPRRAGHRVA